MLQERFVLLDSRAKQRAAALQTASHSSFTAVASLTVTFRGMLHTFRRADHLECPWFSAEGASGLGRYVRDIASQHPCIGTARAIVEAAVGQGEEAQLEADQRAMLVMLSPICELPESDSVEEDEVDVEEMSSEEEDDEQDELLEELDDSTDQLLDNALQEAGGASLLQQGLEESQVVLVIGTMMAFFFGLWLLVVLPFVITFGCVITGVGFVAFSFLGCLLYNLVRLLLGKSVGSCPAFNWLPHCGFRPSEFHAFGREYMRL